MVNGLLIGLVNLLLLLLIGLISSSLYMNLLVTALCDWSDVGLLLSLCSISLWDHLLFEISFIRFLMLEWWGHLWPFEFLVQVDYSAQNLLIVRKQVRLWWMFYFIAKNLLLHSLSWVFYLFWLIFNNGAMIICLFLLKYPFWRSSFLFFNEFYFLYFHTWDILFDNISLCFVLCLF